MPVQEQYNEGWTIPGWLGDAIDAQRCRDPRLAWWETVLDADLLGPDVAAWDAAVEAVRSAQGPVLLRLEVLIESARAHLVHRDRPAAADLLRQAMAAAEHQGAAAAFVRARDLAERSHLSPSSRPPAPAGALTPRANRRSSTSSLPVEATRPSPPNSVAWIRCCQACLSSSRSRYNRTRSRTSSTSCGGIHDSGTSPRSSSCRSWRASIGSVFVRRFELPRAATSAGSATCTFAPAAAHSSAMNRQPVQPSNTTSTSPSN